MPRVRSRKLQVVMNKSMKILKALRIQSAIYGRGYVMQNLSQELKMNLCNSSCSILMYEGGLTRAHLTSSLGLFPLFSFHQQILCVSWHLQHPWVLDFTFLASCFIFPSFLASFQESDPATLCLSSVAFWNCHKLLWQIFT